MSAYALLKSIHVSSAAISLGLFALRGTWMLAGSRLLERRWVRVLPHVNDTLLLASALALAALLGQYPLVQDWLTAKVVLLVVYIVLGSVALRRGRRSRRTRAVAFIAALLTFAAIVATALRRSPNPLDWLQ